MTSNSETENTDMQPYQDMDLRDEDQILKELKGEFLQQYVYSFKQGNHEITNLSYAGIKEAIRRRGHFQIIEQTVEDTNGKIRALVKVHDLINDIDVLGASEAEAEKPFAYVLAVNKAERNAFAKLIPAKFYAELIAEKLKTNPNNRVNVTPHETIQGWEQIPTGNKGPWEKNTDLSDENLQAIIAEMDQAGKTLLEKDGYLYWQLLDNDILVGLGRRKN